MCRNIRTLYNFEPAATTEEVHAAALQYVRKISGFTKPSQANQVAFDHAVEAGAAASMELLASLQTAATAITAWSNAAWFTWLGLVKPLILRTYCSAAACTSSEDAGGSKL